MASRAAAWFWLWLGDCVHFLSEKNQTLSAQQFDLRWRCGPEANSNRADVFDAKCYARSKEHNLGTEQPESGASEKTAAERTVFESDSCIAVRTSLY
jgi:hypothetical protein